MADDWANEARTSEYNNNVSFELNERPGKLSVLPGSMDNYAGQISAVIDNRFDDLYLQKKTTRNGDTNNVDPKMLRRWVKKPGSSNVAPLLDRDDQKSTSLELQSPIVRQTGNAVRRYHDDRFMLGYYGTAWMGEHGDVAVPFTSGNKVSVGFGNAGTPIGVTKAKLLEIRRLLIEANVDMEMEMPVMLLDAGAQTDLLLIQEYVDADYTDNKALMTGEIKPWLGFRFVMANMGQVGAYPDSASLFQVAGVNRLPVFMPSGLHRAVWTEFWGKVTERNDKQHSTQIYAEAESTITRLDEAKCWFVESKPY